MAFPVLPAAFVALAGYAVWRGFRPKASKRPAPENNWQNPNFTSAEEGGLAHEDSRFSSPPPFLNPGGGN